MYGLFVLSETTLRSCLVFTFTALELLSFIAIAGVKWDNCLVVSFSAIALVLFPFIYCLLMLSETTLWSYMGPSFLHVWIVGVKWDNPKKLLGGHIHCMGTSLLHVSLLMLSEITLWSCLVIIFPAWVILSFTYVSLVVSETTLWSCLLITFPAWVLLSFMYESLVLSETTLRSCLVVTFTAWELLSFM